MRAIAFILALFFITDLNAQSYVSPSIMNSSPGALASPQNVLGAAPSYGIMPHFIPERDSASLNKKWSLNKYVGISSSFGFFNGGHVSVFSVPLGLQLNRKLNQNLYAFAGLSVAPSYFTSSRSFNDFNAYKTTPASGRMGSNNFGIYSRAEAGLMYVNDERTFSISGSIGIQNSSYPLYPVSRMNNQRPQPVAGSRL